MSQQYPPRHSGAHGGDQPPTVPGPVPSTPAVGSFPNSGAPLPPPAPGAPPVTQPVDPAGRTREFLPTEQAPVYADEDEEALRGPQNPRRERVDERRATIDSDADDISYERYQAENRSLGEIASDVLDNASTLIRQEVELAKAEVKQSATRAGTGVGLLVGAGVFALLALIALTLAIWWGLGVAIGTSADPALGWSGLLTMVIWLVVAGILGMAGRSSLNKIRGLEQTTETVQQIPNAVTGNEERNR